MRQREIDETVQMLLGTGKGMRTADAIPFWENEITSHNYPVSLEEEDSCAGGRADDGFAIGWRVVCDLLILAKEVLEEARD